MISGRTSSDSERDPFISATEEQHRDSGNRLAAPKARSAWRVHAHLFCLQFFLLLLNLIFFASNLWPQRVQAFGKLTLYEPSNAPVKLEDAQWNLRLGSKSAYTSLDPKVADKAWENLSIGPNQGWLKIQESKLEDIGELAPDRVQFSDKSGYLLGMDVFHQLHCLNYIRKKTILYNKMYPMTATDEQVPPDMHIPHCIDSIRLSLQCHADLTLIPQRWADGWLEPWSVWTNKHQCRNFDSIREWAHKNQPYVGRGQLVHPQLGPVSTGHLNLSALPVYEEERIAANAAKLTDNS